jgi:dihydroflavonol-4-reductase
MKIFITGATGFIGTRVVNRLANTEHEVFCIVRKTNEASERLKSFGAKLITGDVTDKESVFRGMKGCEWVIHLAGLYSFWEKNNRLYKDININGTRNVMECALETKISKVVHVSSVVIYGKPSDSPFTEESEPGPVRFSRYSRTKYEGDLIVWDLYKNKGLPVVVVYPSAVCGPGDTKATGRYVSDIVNKRLPAAVFKNASLTFVHVNDVAEAIIRAAEKQGNTGEKYLIGKEIIAFQEINNMISGISGVHPPKLHMPDFLTMMSAYFLTGISKLIKKQPLWGMSLDKMRVMKEGFRVDGSKAEKELGITYTPVRIALEEHIATFKK